MTLNKLLLPGKCEAFGNPSIDPHLRSLNHVRLPIGYWAFETSHGEPYHSGQLPYMEKTFEWAAKYNLKVIVDLHGESLSRFRINF